MREPLTLFWKDYPLGTITGCGWSDFPWAMGCFTPGEIPSDLRALLDWLARVAASDDDLPDPPFPDDLLENWSLRDAGGRRLATCHPLVDFAAGTIEFPGGGVRSVEPDRD